MMRNDTAASSSSSSFNHVLRRRRRHVTNPHSCHLSAGSPRDTGRCRSLWCCSTSVQDHKRVCWSHIHLCLQRTQREPHSTSFLLNSRPRVWQQTIMFGLHELCDLSRVNCVSHTVKSEITDGITSQAGTDTHVHTESVPLNKRGPLFCSSG